MRLADIQYPSTSLELNNVLVNSLNIFGLERRASNDKSVQDNTHRPCVDFEAVSIRGIEQHFWCNIVWGATNSFLPLPRALNERSEPKVTDLDIHVGVEEQITQFKIPMNNLVRVHVMACSNQLHHEKTCFRFGETAATAEHVHQ